MTNFLVVDLEHLIVFLQAGRGVYELGGGGTILLKIDFYSKSGVHFFGKKPQLLSKKTWNIREKKQRFLFLKKTKSFFFFLRISKKKKGVFFCWKKIMKNLIHFWTKNRVLPPLYFEHPHQKNVVPTPKMRHILAPPSLSKKGLFWGVSIILKRAI